MLEWKVRLGCTGKEQGAVLTVMALLGKAGIAGAWAAAQVFSAEVFPTVVRCVSDLVLKKGFEAQIKAISSDTHWSITC